MSDSKKETGSKSTKAQREVGLLIEILRLATYVHRPMKSKVADGSELSVSETRLLMCLAGEGALAGQEMADLMGMSAMNVSRALATLEQKGLIERVDNNDNRRRKPMTLTAAGRRAFDTLQEPLAEVASLMLKGLKAQEQRQLADALAKLNANTVAAAND